MLTRATIPFAMTVACLAGLTAAQPAFAGHRVVIDPTNGLTTQDCSISAPDSCTAEDLGFNINIGGTLTSQAFLYTGGIVSLGTALSGYPSGGSTPSAYGTAIVSAGQGSTSDSSGYYGFLDQLSPTSARITYFSGAFVNGSGNPLPVELDDGEMILITDDSGVTGNAGDFTLQFIYDFTDAGGHTDVDNSNNAVPMSFTQAYTPPLVSGFEGFTLGGSTSSRSINTDGVVDETFTFRNGSLATNNPAVPEPASWACFIAGFALIGGVARQSAMRRPALR